jgi:hypothetical protein
LRVKKSDARTWYWTDPETRETVKSGAMAEAPLEHQGIEAGHANVWAPLPQRFTNPGRESRRCGGPISAALRNAG